jgi:hypothetical protein
LGKVDPIRRYECDGAFVLLKRSSRKRTMGRLMDHYLEVT